MRTVTSCFLASLAVLVASATALCQEEDLIDTRTLSGRGVAFETRVTNPGRLIGGLVQSVDGVGDFNGDGFSDIAVLDVNLDESGEPIQTAYLIFGAADWPETSVLSRGLEGTLAFWLQNLRVVGGPWLAGVTGIGDLDENSLDDLAFSVSGGPGAPPAVIHVLYGDVSLREGGTVEEIGIGFRGSVLFSSDPAIRGVGRGLVARRDLDGDGGPTLRWGPARSRG